MIVGNHRDAWVFGGVDPSSGTAALVELARTLGELQRVGMATAAFDSLRELGRRGVRADVVDRVGRTASGMAAEHAVAYLNVDSAASGPNLRCRRYRRSIAARRGGTAVKDPARALRSPTPRDRQTRTRFSAVAAADDLVVNRIGGGSDYTVFLNHLGVPVVDLSFKGPYGVYHSIYDNHAGSRGFGDPGFRYHAALVQLWGLVALGWPAPTSFPSTTTPTRVRLSASSRRSNSDG